mgnify:CR=1 FL=1
MNYCYKNGNYIVNNIGNRLIKRACRLGEELVASFPDSIDLKISNSNYIYAGASKLLKIKVLYIT